MKSLKRAIVITAQAALVIAATMSICRAAPAPASGADDRRLTVDAARQHLVRAAVPFAPNAGQWDPEAAFAARTLAGTLFVTREGRLVYHLPAPGDQRSIRSRAHPGRFAPGQSSAADEPARPAPGWSLIETFVGDDGRPLAIVPRGTGASAAKVTYFAGGDPSLHRSGVATFERVDLGEVFPGVNVQLRATGSNVEKIFAVAPRHDSGQIRVRVDGATRLELGSAGELIAHTGNGPVAYTAPVAWQEDATGGRTSIDVRYEIAAPRAPVLLDLFDDGEESIAGIDYTFAVGAYDRARPLIIDPLLQSTYLGGGNSDSIVALVVHPATGDIYAAGYTQGAAFPGVAGGADSSYGGGRDAFVSRLSSDLTRLIQSTYLSGTGNFNIAGAIAVHPASGDVYIAGTTNSDAGSFPGVAGGAQSVFGGNGPLVGDAFVSRLSSDLTVLRQSTYLGGSADDAAAAIVIHPVTGDVYVGGDTTSATGFPQVTGGAQPTFGGAAFPGDAFISRLNSGLTQIIQSTYLGGSSADQLAGLAIHPATGDVYATGSTNSAGFPGVGGGAQAVPGPNGNRDVFVSRLNRTLTSVLQSTYLGGDSNDDATAIAIHPVSGEVYIAGYTRSAPGTFPVSLPLGANLSYSADVDGFVTRLNPALTTINKWTYLGSSGLDLLNGLAIHPDTGEIYVVGSTNSTAFPGVANGQQDALAGADDLFVSRLTADLDTLIQSTFLGAAGDDQGTAIAVHAGTGEIYVAGITASGPAAFPGVAGGAQATIGGGTDGFISRLSPDLTAIDSIPDRFAFLAQSYVPPNTLRTSNAVRLKGMTASADIFGYVQGQPGSQLCHTDVERCCEDPSPQPLCASATFISGWQTSSPFIFNDDYIQVRHTSQNPAGVAETQLIIGGTATPFRSSSGNAAFRCNLDMNGDNKLDATVEGLVLIRAMFGLTGTAVTQGTGVTIPWATLGQMLNTGCGTNF